MWILKIQSNFAYFWNFNEILGDLLNSRIQSIANISGVFVNISWIPSNISFKNIDEGCDTCAKVCTVCVCMYWCAMFDLHTRFEALRQMYILLSATEQQTQLKIKFYSTYYSIILACPHMCGEYITLMQFHLSYFLDIWYHWFFKLFRALHHTHIISLTLICKGPYPSDHIE